MESRRAWTAHGPDFMAHERDVEAYPADIVRYWAGKRYLSGLSGGLREEKSQGHVRSGRPKKSKSAGLHGITA